jgi:hypothetical protein
MTPNEIYALPTIGTDNWFDYWNEIAENALGLAAWDNNEALQAADSGRLVVNTKLDINFDGDRGVTIRSLEFDGVPFALYLTGGRGGSDKRDVVVTDRGAWKRAKAHALTLIAETAEFTDTEASADDDLLNGYYGARIVRFGSDVRLVKSDHVHPISGSPVFDDLAYDAEFDRVIRPLGEELGYESGLGDPRMMTAAVDTMRKGIIGRAIHFESAVTDGQRLVGASVVDGQTFMHSLGTSGSHYTWKRGGYTRMVGPASMLGTYEAFYSGRGVSLDDPYVVELAAAFGADVETARGAVLAHFERPYYRSVPDYLLSAMPRVAEVPPEITVGYEGVAVAWRVAAEPALRRFCANGYPSEEQAVRTMSKARDISRKIRNGESKAPGP